MNARALSHHGVHFRTGRCELRRFARVVDVQRFTQTEAAASVGSDERVQDRDEVARLLVPTNGVENAALGVEKDKRWPTPAFKALTHGRLRVGVDGHGDERFRESAPDLWIFVARGLHPAAGHAAFDAAVHEDHAPRGGGLGEDLRSPASPRDGWADFRRSCVLSSTTCAERKKEAKKSKVPSHYRAYLVVGRLVVIPCYKEK